MVKEAIHGVLEVWLGESRLIQFIWGEKVVLNWPGNCLLWTSLPLVKSCYNLCLPQFRIGFLIWILDLKFVIFGHVGLFSLCKLCSYLAAITFVNWISFFFHVVSCLIEVGFFVHVFICLVCNGFVTICFLDRILRQLTWHFNLCTPRLHMMLIILFIMSKMHCFPCLWIVFEVFLFPWIIVIQGKTNLTQIIIFFHRIWNFNTLYHGGEALCCSQIPECPNAPNLCLDF